MFGYVVPNRSVMSKEEDARFQACYCGLCRTLRVRYSLLGSVTLSNDLTFMAMLLSGLYEPKEQKGREVCPTHPFKMHDYVTDELTAYAADMNVALAYHKMLDNWLDDRNVVSLTEAKLFERAYGRIRREHPEKCRIIESWLDEIHAIEASGTYGIDAPVNATGKMLGCLFAPKDDWWKDTLYRVGDGLGRYIYLMDAYDDLERDIRKKRYNPLITMKDDSSFETMISDALTMAVADCTMAFEELPVFRNEGILRNILYSGIWSRYAQIKRDKEDKKGAKE